MYIVPLIYFYLSGKSLLCKEGAIRMTKRSGGNRAVYYISLLAADSFGRPLNQYFTFDEASKLDLKDTNVIVLNVHQLQIRYRQRNSDLSEDLLQQMTVYELVEDLIDADPMASYFFDECPFIARPFLPSSIRLSRYGNLTERLYGKTLYLAS